MKRVNPRRWTSELETVAFRLTRTEILFIRVGLKPCVCSWAYGMQFGRFPNTDFFRVCPRLRPRGGKFDQRFMDYILAASTAFDQWAKDASAQSHRVRLDPITIAILALLVRVANTQIRHRHADSPVAEPAQVKARLSRKLENQRRRALRKTRASGKGAAYVQLAGQWHQFQLWIRCSLLYCRCHRPSPFSSRKRDQLAIAECEKVARKVIEEYELRMPEGKKLRELVRMAIHYASRGRLGVGLRTLLEGDNDSFFIWKRFLFKRLPAANEVKLMEGV